MHMDQQNPQQQHQHDDRNKNEEDLWKLVEKHLNVSNGSNDHRNDGNNDDDGVTTIDDQNHTVRPTNGESPCITNNEPSLSSTACGALKVSSNTSVDIYTNNPLVLICDAWYGFPSQKRPRKERMLAVSRQITNFLVWERNRSSAGSKKDEDKKEKEDGETSSHHQYCDVYVIGENGDVDKIEERVNRLLQDDENKGNNNNKWKEHDCCIFLPGVTLEQLLLDLAQQQRRWNTPLDPNNKTLNHHPTTTTTSNDESNQSQEQIVYLSPDADQTLDPDAPPPSIIIVGMLVDRSIQPNRSKKRATEAIQGLAQYSVSPSNTNITFDNNQSNDHESPNPNISKRFDSIETIEPINIRCARLPLDALGAIDLKSDEALNVDTVLELTKRWWDNFYHPLHRSRHCFGDRDQQPENRVVFGEERKSFVDAVVGAMSTHRARHPNRVLHGGASGLT